MNVAMFTNTYAPMVGGVERSIETFCADLRALGHRTLVVAPSYRDARESDDWVFRVPAVENVGEAGHSVRLPLLPGLSDRLDAFQPDVIHCHQPFLLGDTALRKGRRRGVPVLFTFHTLYERYIDQADTDSDALRRLAVTLPVDFANLCDAVIAPTPGIAEEIRRRGVERPVHPVPTGIDSEKFAGGDQARARRRWGIPTEAPLLGHIGRLIPAKNLDYLARAAAAVLAADERAWLMLVGDGESVDPMRRRLNDAGVGDRVVFTGRLTGRELVDAYTALDLFLFTSLTDTQGIVLLEAFSAGVPVVALDATGPCDVVVDRECGRLIRSQSSPTEFAQVAAELLADADRLAAMATAARRRAKEYHHTRCAERLAEVYGETRASTQPTDLDGWDRMIARTKVEWALLAEKVHVAVVSLFGT